MDKNMISNRDLANQSIETLAQMIETHHQETEQLYQALASKMTKQTEGSAFLSDDNVAAMEYWLKVAKEQPQILSAGFDLKGLESVTAFFKAVASLSADNDARIALLKTARDNASQDCAWYISHIRKRVKELESNPIFKLILQKAPNAPRQYTVKKAASTPQPTKA
jgi:hypothetical protein